MFFAIFRKLRLFWFAFFLAVNGLTMSAILAGHTSYEEIQTRVKVIATYYLQKNPEGVPTEIARYIATQFVDTSPPVEATGTQQRPTARPNTIEALRANRG